MGISSFGYDQQLSQPDKSLTGELGGLFPRVAREIKIIFGSQVVRGEFSLDGRLDCGRAPSANVHPFAPGHRLKHQQRLNKKASQPGTTAGTLGRLRRRNSFGEFAS
jgi:hypothetical protein